MTGARKSLLRVALAAKFLALLSTTSPLLAEVTVSIQYGSEERLELAQRVASELSAEGYAVEIHSEPVASPCDPNGSRLAGVTPGTKAWIRLSASPSGDDAVVASICYLGALPFLQQASPSAPRSDPRRLALATAEALNGLRSKLPPLVGDPDGAAKHEDPPNEPRRRRDTFSSDRLTNSVVFGTALVSNLPDFPVAPGVEARATLGLAPSLGIAIDAFFPTSGRELSSSEVTATLRTTWLRAGPRLRWLLGDFDFSGAVLAGPAVTWATAVARAPRVGSADVSTGAILSLAAFVEYPRKTAVFACASTSASTLLPGARVNLGNGQASPRGSFPIEASIGFGVRWGTEP
jgi:hypothetical protein